MYLVKYTHTIYLLLPRQHIDLGNQFWEFPIIST